MRPLRDEGSTIGAQRRFCGELCSGLYAAESSDKRDAEPAAGADAAAASVREPVSKSKAGAPPKQKVHAVAALDVLLQPCQGWMALPCTVVPLALHQAVAASPDSTLMTPLYRGCAQGSPSTSMPDCLPSLLY